MTNRILAILSCFGAVLFFAVAASGGRVLAPPTHRARWRTAGALQWSKSPHSERPGAVLVAGRHDLKKLPIGTIVHRTPPGLPPSRRWRHHAVVVTAVVLTKP